MRANIGCGNDRWGDIRVDIVKRYLERKVVLNIVAHAEYLPFRNNCFEELRCYHVIEHLSNWRRGLYEIMRASKVINLKFPTKSGLTHSFIWGVFNLYLFTNLKLMLLFPKRRKEHLWQIKPEIVIQILERQNFEVKSFQINSRPWFICPFKNLRKCLPKFASEWEIVAVRKGMTDQSSL